MGSHCTANILNPATMAGRTNKPRPQEQQAKAHTFDDLLKKPWSQASSTMPANRPKCLDTFCLRDQAYFEELARLDRGVVFDTHGHELNFTAEDVFGFVTRTGLVKKAEISIGILSRERFLIILPLGLAPETFIRATSYSLWEGGFIFQSWSQLDRGMLALPEYKVLLDLVDVPPPLYREKEIANAVATFGTFLGSIPQSNLANLTRWTVAVAVDQLERVPEAVAMHAGGVKHMVTVETKNWLRSPLYTAADLPRHKPKFSKADLNSKKIQEEVEPFVVSQKALLQICKGNELSTLPEEVQQFLLSTTPNLPEILAQASPQDIHAGQTSNSLNVAISEAGQSSKEKANTPSPATAMPQQIWGSREGNETVVPSPQPICILHRDKELGGSPSSARIPQMVNNDKGFPSGKGDTPTREQNRSSNGSNVANPRTLSLAGEDYARPSVLEDVSTRAPKRVGPSGSKPNSGPKGKQAGKITPKPIKFDKPAQQSVKTR